MSYPACPLSTGPRRRIITVLSFLLLLGTVSTGRAQDASAWDNDQRSGLRLIAQRSLLCSEQFGRAWSWRFRLIRPRGLAVLPLRVRVLRGLVSLRPPLQYLRALRSLPWLMLQSPQLIENSR